MSHERTPLPSPVGRVLQSAAAPAVIDRLWHGHGRRRADRRARGRSALAAVAVALVIGGSAFALGRATVTEPRAFVAPVAPASPSPVAATRLPAVIVGHETPSRIELDDGSWIEAAPGARLETQHEDEREVWLSLVAGRVEIEVQPASLRRWVVESPLARVQVVGTRFVVSLEQEVVAGVPQASRVAVRVSHGVVRVLSPWIDGAVAMVAAGESLEVTRTPTVGARESGPPPRDSRATVARTVRGAAETPSEDELDQLFREADALRRAGRPAEALAPLARILSASPHGADGALAAFTMARIYEDALGDDSRAREVLARARAIGLPEALESEARTRWERLDGAEDAPALDPGAAPHP